jgi:hypothetical protein
VYSLVSPCGLNVLPEVEIKKTGHERGFQNCYHEHKDKQDCAQEIEQRQDNHTQWSFHTRLKTAVGTPLGQRVQPSTHELTDGASPRCLSS